MARPGTSIRRQTESINISAIDDDGKNEEIVSGSQTYRKDGGHDSLTDGKVEEPKDNSATDMATPSMKITPDTPPSSMESAKPSDHAVVPAPEDGNSNNNIVAITDHTSSNPNHQQRDSENYPRTGGQDSRSGTDDVPKEENRGETSPPEPFQSDTRLPKDTSSRISRLNGSSSIGRPNDSSRLSRPNDPSRIGRLNNPSRTMIVSRSRRQDPSRASILSGKSSFYHGDFVDDNLLLSAARIDSTLLRLFSRSRDGKENKMAAVGEGEEDKLLPFLNYSESELISLEAVLWRVHPMESTHKAALEQEVEFLEENVRPRELLRRLYMEEVITHMDYNTISRTEGQGERAVTRLLVRTLMRRGHKAWPALLEALQVLEYDHVTKRLAEAEATLRRAMEEERTESQLRSSQSSSWPVHASGQQQLGVSSLSNSNNDHYLYSALAGSALSTGAQHHHHHYHHTTNNNNSIDSNNEKNLISTNNDLHPTHTHEGDLGHQQNSSFPQDLNATSRDIEGESSADPATSRSTVVDAGKLKEQLSGLEEELRALHLNVTALRTARSQATGRDDPNLDPQQTSKQQPRPQKSGTCTVL